MAVEVNVPTNLAPASAPESSRKGRRSRRRAGRSKETPSRAPDRRPWNDAGVMEDGGLAIVDEHGELRHVTAARVATSVRYLLARLQTEADSDIPRRMAFTSTLSGEGVTFIANSFASVLAHDLARRVCVVDLNWWSSGNGESKEGAEPRPGMFEVLWRETDIADVLVATQTPNLWLLPPGRAPLSVRPI